MNATSTSIMRNINSDEYLQLYQEYLRIDDIYSTSPNLFSTPPCKMTKDTIDVDFHETKFLVKKPMYANYLKTMEAYEKEKKELLSEYMFEKNRFVYGEHQNRNSIQALTQKVARVNQEMKRVEQAMEAERSAIEKDINLSMSKGMKSDSDSKDQFDKISEINDDILKKNKIQDYLTTKNDTKVLNESNKNEQVRLEHFRMIMSDYMVSSPETSTPSKALVSPTRPTTKDPQKIKLKTKLKTKLASQPTQTKTDAEVKKEFKETVKKMVFKTLEECNSTKHSKPYYMSKAKLYELIEKDPELKKKVGKMYKKMSRSELCDNLLS